MTKIGDKVVFTIRVYNEGSIKGYASEVKDYLPPYLTFVKDSEINEKYEWKLSSDARIVTTTYLADKELKQTQKRYFQILYNMLLGKDQGPKLGLFLMAIDKQKIKNLL